MPAEPLLGKDSDKLSKTDKHLKVFGMMMLGFLITRKKMIITVAILGLLIAIILAVLLLF